MKKFCTSLRKHAKNIIDFEKKKMLLLTKQDHIKIQKYAIIVEKESQKKLSKTINYHKYRDHCHYTGKYRDAGHSICN